MAALINRLRPYSAQFGLFAIVALVLSFAARQLGSNPPWLPQAFLGIGIVLLVLYVIADWEEILRVLSGRQVRYGGNALLFTIAVIGIVTVLNYLFAFRYHQSFDLTANKQFTLSSQTVDALNKLQTPVQVTGFFVAQGGQRQQADDLVKQYQEHTNKIQYRDVDPELDPTTARALGATSPNSFIVQQGDRKQEVLNPQEADLTNAIIKVTSIDTKAIYFVTGHKEHSPTDSAETGISNWSNILTSNNYKVSTINLSASGGPSPTGTATVSNTTTLSQALTLTQTNTSGTTVPNDAVLVVIAGPQSPFSDPEKQNLAQYVKNGGSLLVMLDPQLPDPIGDTLMPYGVRFRNDIVIETDPSRVAGNVLVLITSQYGSQPVITSKLQGATTVFPGARSIDILKGVPPTVTVTSLVDTSAQSFSHTDLSFLKGGQLKRDPADTPGPLSILAISQIQDAKGRVALVGNSEFLSNATLSQAAGSANVDLALNTVNWLAKNEEAAVAIQPKAPDQRQIRPLTQGQSLLLLLGSVFLMPVLTLISGLLVWLRRR